MVNMLANPTVRVTITVAKMANLSLFKDNKWFFNLFFLLKSYESP